VLGVFYKSIPPKRVCEMIINRDYPFLWGHGDESYVLNRHPVECAEILIGAFESAAEEKWNNILLGLSSIRSEHWPSICNLDFFREYNPAFDPIYVEAADKVLSAGDYRDETRRTLVQIKELLQKVINTSPSCRNLAQDRLIRIKFALGQGQ
jgi:hypothetical protein